MSLIRRIGNLIELTKSGEFDVVVHGCNCQNVMGSGIAKQLRETWPGVYEADQIATETWKVPVAKLGNFSTYSGFTEDNRSFTIINAYTQLHFLPRGIDHFHYVSFELILEKLEHLAIDGIRFGFPAIGMGLAGGNPEKIMKLLNSFALRATEKGATVTLVELG